MKSQKKCNIPQFIWLVMSLHTHKPCTAVFYYKLRKNKYLCILHIPILHNYKTVEKLCCNTVCIIHLKYKLITLAAIVHSVNINSSTQVLTEIHKVFIQLLYIIIFLYLCYFRADCNTT